MLAHPRLRRSVADSCGVRLGGVGEGKAGSGACGTTNGATFRSSGRDREGLGFSCCRGCTGAARVGTRRGAMVTSKTGEDSYCAVDRCPVVRMAKTAAWPSTETAVIATSVRRRLCVTADSPASPAPLEAVGGGEFMSETRRWAAERRWLSQTLTSRALASMNRAPFEAGDSSCRPVERQVPKRTARPAGTRTNARRRVSAFNEPDSKT